MIESNKKRFFILIFLVLLVLILAFALIFIIYKEASLKKSKFHPPIKIGFAMSTLKEERWFFDRNILIAKAKEKGFEIEWTNANENDSQQFQQVKYLLSKNIDILLLVPSSYDNSKKTVELAKAKRIPVIAYDRLILGTDIDAYVSFNNYKVGELMAKYLSKKAPKGNYVFILGNPKDYNTLMIREGYRKVLLPYIKSKKINILLEDYCYKWKKEYAYEYVSKLLQENKKIDSILCANDSLAEGAINALAEKMLAGKVPVVGQDAELSACKRIVAGSQLMTVYKPINALVDLTLNVIENVLKGKLPYTKNYINNGYKMVPAYYVEPIPVTYENIVDTIVKDNFHSYSDIFEK